MKSRLTHIFLTLVLISVPGIVFAQMGGDGSERHGMMGKGMMGGSGMEMHGMGMDMDAGMMEMMKMMGAASRLDLTPDQKKKLQSIKLTHQKEAIPLFSKIRLSGVEIQELLQDDPVPMEKVKAKVQEKHDVMAKLEVSHLAMKQQVRAILTPEQRQRLESTMMDMMETMDMGSMMGGPAKGSEDTSREAPETPSGAPSTTKDPHGH
jgi:Spy/CpxP family protein refolding chaperone